MIGIALAEAAEHGGGGGMPQFQSSTFSSQSFWAIVSFLVLLYLLKRYVIPGISNVLDARSKQIENDLASAKKFRDDAEKTMLQYKEMMNSAWENAKKTQEEARQEAVRYRDKQMEEVEEKLARKKSAAMDEIELAKRTAVAEIRSYAVDVVIESTRSLISKTVSQEDAQLMVDDTIRHLEKSSASHLH